jgi:outer membrane protein assembly factor BamB
MRAALFARVAPGLILFAGLALASTQLVGQAPPEAGGQRRATPSARAWPQWHGPNRDNLSAEEGLLRQWDADGPTLAWESAGLGAGFSSIAIVGDRIFTMGDLGGEQYVIAVTLPGGQPVWKTKVGPGWDDQYPGPRGTPTVDGALLYALGTEGDLVCLETATGKERWRRSLPRDFGGQMMSGWKFSESPLVDGDRVLVTPGARDAMIVALDKRTGKEVWRSATPDLGTAGRDGAAYSSIMVSNGAGVKQYVQLTGRGLIGVRAQDGKFLWNYNRVANGTANIPTPAIKGDYVFASTGYQTGSALLKLSPTGAGLVQAEEVYFLDSRKFQNHHGGFLLVGDHIYAGQGHRMGIPICLDFATGAVKWGGDIRNEGRGSAAITYADGNLYFRYENGLVMLIAATPEGHQQRGMLKLPESRYPSWSHPVVFGGKLYLREQDKLYVYELTTT